MPAIKQRRDLLQYFTREEMEATYFRLYLALGYSRPDAIAAAKNAARRI